MSAELELVELLSARGREYMAQRIREAEVELSMTREVARLLVGAVGGLVRVEDNAPAFGANRLVTVRFAAETVPALLERLEPGAKPPSFFKRLLAL